MLPDYCIAFRNGVYNFKDNEWFFKYDIVQLVGLSNKMYMYDPTYTILWYMNYDFEPLMFGINDLDIIDFILGTVFYTELSPELTCHPYYHPF